MKYKHIVAEVFSKPWAILPEKLRIITDLVRLRASGQILTADEIRARVDPEKERHLEQRAASRAGAGDYGIAAVIPVYGLIQNRSNLMSDYSGGTSIQKLTKQFRSALADPAVKAIVFDVDSPGGGVEGVPELADEIYKSRGQKKSIAVANAMSASAAYWIASAATELFVVPSGQVGSIGVFIAHEDVSKALDTEGTKVTLIQAGKYKTDGNPYEPLSDSAREDLQSKVNSFYEMFVKAVARGRGVAQSAVRDGFGQGRMVVAADALKMKMVDGIATLDDTIARVGGTAPARRIGATAAAPTISAADPNKRIPGDDGDPDQDEDDPEDDDTTGSASSDLCQCECNACANGAHAECMSPACQDPNCVGCPMQPGARSAAPKKPLSNYERELDLLDE